MKSPTAYFNFFGARFVKSFTRQNVAVPKKKSILFVRMICSMFMGYLVQT